MSEPLWVPTPESLERAEITRYLRRLEERTGRRFDSYDELWQWSIDDLDGFWASKAADLARITVPAFVVASWSDQGLHTRGTFEGFKRISSPRKWLDAHGGKKWGYYYAPESLRRQLAFFDHVLKGADTEVSGWPAVSYEVRDRPGASARKSADGWPLAAAPP